MEAEHDFAPGRFFEAQPLSADGDTAVGADLDRRAHAPNVVPPRTVRNRADHRTVFFPGLVPGPQGGLAQLAMGFVGVAVGPQSVDMRIGDVDLVDLLTGEVSG
jgi:hypothetical protein